MRNVSFNLIARAVRENVQGVLKFDSSEWLLPEQRVDRTVRF